MLAYLLVQVMQDPNGIPRKVYPILLTVIADMKEKWELMCLYGNGAVIRPCPACIDSREAMQLKVDAIIAGRDVVDSRCVCD